MLSQFSKAIGSYGTAMRYMTKRRIWTLQILPGFISLLIGAIIFGSAYFWGSNLGAWMGGWYPWEWGAQVVEKFFNVLGWILIIVSGLFLYRYILLIAISPFLSLLSEKVEEIYVGTEGASFSLTRMVRDTARGIRMTIRNLIRELFYTVLLFLLGFIPGMRFLVTPMTFLVQSYYAGFGNMDFTLERYYPVRDRVAFCRANKGLAIGNGLVFLLLLMIPIVGLFLGPTLSVIASTIDVLDEIDEME